MAEEKRKGWMEESALARIEPGPLAGEVRAVPSKSDAHRLLIAAALADVPTTLLFEGSSRDIEATIGCLETLGAAVERRRDRVIVTPLEAGGSGQKAPEARGALPELDCGESGSTLRFLLPVAAALGGKTAFTARPGLATRPLGALKEAMERQGAVFSRPALPFALEGPLRGGLYRLPGNISSQYISGLLFALPLLAEDSRIELSTPLESAGYVEMTLSTLRRFSINIEETADGYRIPGRQAYRSPGLVEVEGDWSNAAFFLTAGALGKGVTVTGLRPDSLQRDREIVSLLRRFGAEIRIEGDRVTALGGKLVAIEVDAGQIPDLVPILAVAAAFAEGSTVIRNAARLRIKESDRLATVAAMLRGLGASAEELPEGLLIRGGAESGGKAGGDTFGGDTSGRGCLAGRLPGGRVDSANDHRIAMAAAIGAAYGAGPTEILDPWAVRKSYPGFYQDFSELGGKPHVL